jgi:DNA replication initiation complex subunit (GINS family)
MAEYSYRVENWSNGRYVVIRDDKGRQITRYKYNWNIVPEDNYIQAKNIIEELEERDREQAIREEETQSFDIARVDKVRRSVNPLARRYQYIVNYNGNEWFSLMTNRLFSETDLFARIERTVNKNYGHQLESIDYIELVESS